MFKLSHRVSTVLKDALLDHRIHLSASYLRYNVSTKTNKSTPFILAKYFAASALTQGPCFSNFKS